MGPENSHPGWDGAPGHLRLELHGTMTGRLPRSGPPLHDLRTEPNPDYPDDTDLCFDRGEFTDRIRLTPEDRPKLFAAAGGLAGGHGELRQRAAELARHNVPALDLAGRTAHVAAALDLVSEAHAAGYRLCADDLVPPSCSDEVADALAGLLADGEDRPHADVEALERVISMLRATS